MGFEDCVESLKGSADNLGSAEHLTSNFGEAGNTVGVSEEYEEVLGDNVEVLGYTLDALDDKLEELVESLRYFVD